MTEPVRMTLKRKEIPLELEGVNGEMLNYTLRELKGSDRDNFAQANDRRMVKGPDGKPTGVKDYKNMLSNLLSISVYDENGKPIPESLIQEWPTSTQTKLFEMAAELSGLSITKEAREELEKNSQENG